MFLLLLLQLLPDPPAGVSGVRTNESGQVTVDMPNGSVPVVITKDHEGFNSTSSHPDVKFSSSAQLKKQAAMIAVRAFPLVAPESTC